MCNDGNGFVPFNTESYFSTVNEYVFYPITGWMPSFTGFRAALRLLAEQGDGLDVIPAIRTATTRYDINGAEGLNPWVARGSNTSLEGDTDPQDVDITADVNGEFWLQLGLGVRKSSGASAIGQGQAGIQFNLPTERLVLAGGPVVLDTVTNPVGDAWAELWASDWMSFYDLQEVAIPYSVYEAVGYEFKFVLQSVKTDPTKQAPSEDDIVSATTGPDTSVVTSSTFTQATTNKAQFCRVVMKARATGATEGTGRAWFAVAVKYA